MRLRAGFDLRYFSSLNLGAVLFILLVVSIFPGAGSAHCAQLTVAWDPNNDASTAGYKIHYGTQSRNYTTTIDVGNTTQHVVTDLQAGAIYFFAATAYDASGNQSDFSVELAVNTPNDPPSNAQLDSDGDGLSDADEISIYGTDPNNPDSDGDGMSDGQEVVYWGDNWDGDDDGDGIINLLDPTPTRQALPPEKKEKKVNMGPILSLLLD